jgi:hypothetical protein
MALDDFYTALDRFKSNVDQLNFERTLNGANDAVRQVRNSEIER